MGKRRKTAKKQVTKAMLETVYCCYCRGKLETAKERNQEYHTICYNEIKKYYEVQEGENRLLEKIKKIIQLPYFQNRENRSIVYIADEQFVRKAYYRDETFVIFLEGGNIEVENELTSISGVRWQKIDIKALKQIWDVLKETKVGKLLLFDSIQDDNLKLLLQMRDLFIFPIFKIENNDIIMEKNSNVKYTDVNDKDYMNMNDYVRITLSENIQDRKILGVDFSENIASRIKKIPGFYKILEENIFSTLKKPEQEFLTTMKEVFSKNYLRIKFYYNTQAQTIHIECFKTGSKKGRNRKSKRKRRKEFSIDLKISNGRKKEFSELIIQEMQISVIEKFFAMNWYKFTFTTITIHARKETSIQMILRNIRDIKTAELKIYATMPNIHKTSALDFVDTRMDVETLSFTSNSFFILKNVDVLRNIKEVKLCNATVKQFKTSNYLERIELTGTSELPGGIYELPERVSNLEIDLTIVGKIVTRREISVKNLTFNSKDSPYYRLSSEEIEHVVNIINSIQDLEKLCYMHDCSSLRRIFEKSKPIKTLVLKNPTSFRDEPTGQEQGIKNLEELILEEPWYLRVPDFIGKLKKIRSMTINFPCFYDMGPGLDDIHELDVINRLPELETLHIRSAYLDQWQETLPLVPVIAKIVSDDS